MRFPIWALLVVIVDPYEGLDYNKINVYEFENQNDCYEKCINYTESEGYSDSYPAEEVIQEEEFKIEDYLIWDFSKKK